MIRYIDVKLMNIWIVIIVVAKNIYLLNQDKHVKIKY